MGRPSLLSPSRFIWCPNDKLNSADEIFVRIEVTEAQYIGLIVVHSNVLNVFFDLGDLFFPN